MAVRGGQVILADINPRNVYFTAIQGWGLMRWSRQQQAFYGPATTELLNRLAGLLKDRLPPQVEELRQQLNRVDAAVDAQRMEENPEPLYKFPVKLPMYRHQVRGANMALMVFGLIDPPEQEKEKRG